jgi:hypothetical protein
VVLIDAIKPGSVMHSVAVSISTGKNTNPAALLISFYPGKVGCVECDVLDSISHDPLLAIRIKAGMPRRSDRKLQNAVISNSIRKPYGSHSPAPLPPTRPFNTRSPTLVWHSNYMLPSAYGCLNKLAANQVKCWQATSSANYQEFFVSFPAIRRP